MGWIDQPTVARIRRLLQSFGLPVQPPATIPTERWLELMAVDKKVLDGTLRLVLLRGIGDALVTTDFSAEQLRATIDEA